MRRSKGALHTRNAYQALLQLPQQQQQQRRVLSSAAFCPAYFSPASGSHSALSIPLFASSIIFSSVSSSSTAKIKRTSIFAFASYSTANSPTPYPLPGSNNEIDPRGVDYSLFEPQDSTYVQQVPSSPNGASAAETSHSSTDSGSTSTVFDPSTKTPSTLSPPTQLLARLIGDEEFETATQVLHELQTLRTPLSEPLPIFSSAAMWAVHNDRPNDMLLWMRLCPGYVSGTKYLNTASNNSYSVQVRSVSRDFRKCFLVLLNAYGDDLRLLQRASMIAVEKGLWGVLQSLLAQILRFGVGNMMPGEARSNPDVAWQYFNRIVQVHQAQKGQKDPSKKRELQVATMELSRLYNLGIRTLALAGRLDDALLWADKSVMPITAALRKVLKVDGFTENFLVEELVKGGDDYYIERARVLTERLANNAARPVTQTATNVDTVLERVQRESAFTSSGTYANCSDRSETDLDGAILFYLRQGDLVAARNHLLSVLNSSARIWRDDTNSALVSTSTIDNDSVFSHLPSAYALSSLHDTAHKLGTIGVTTSLTEPDMHSDTTHASSSSNFETLTAEEFLRPIRKALLDTRGGRGLWETSRLYGLVKKEKYREAIGFYVGKSGFRLPAGGITPELIGLALDSTSATGKGSKHVQRNAGRSKQWPSTHAINLMLRAITGLCVERKDYNRLAQVYDTWKAASLPTHSSASSSSHADSDVGKENDGLPELVFTQWLPSQRPDSHTFDPFLRAFARIHTSSIPTEDSPSTSSSVSSNITYTPFGSSSAVLPVIRDMTNQFQIRPSISSWTIALECLGREGRSRWSTTTSVLARAVGINTVSPLPLCSSSSGRHNETRNEGEMEGVKGPQEGFAPANLATYTALIRALVRVAHQDGGSMVYEASGVRDDLLLRTRDLDVAVRQLVSTEEEEEAESGQTFYIDLLSRWQAVQQAVSERKMMKDDRRERWDAATMLEANDGRTVEALKDLWMVETAQSHAEIADSFH
ncbi:uncharacterized protein MEPE_06140 [Melanopsichium pennsylvanicum]|uniref:Uncharacterized protein n=2 Tax=Melanopsichium pennsylvanicum TaxID=63383 RepID=A0AAJ4XS01_9BASI|nr:putative protein [Melanopsichium pennsylvanicum 4]SNX87430.1 uncharacterized protein MEPE_06140 [Melanopsichium pennsylvanicum]